MIKRERVLKALDLDEPDIIPIHHSGFERTGTAYQAFVKIGLRKKYFKIIRGVGDITQWRFWNSDLQTMDPFRKTKGKNPPSPPEYPGHRLGINGTLKKQVLREKTGKKYGWYVGGYFKHKETLKHYWDKYGTPSQRFNQNEGYSAKKWQKYCKRLEKYLFPMAGLATNIWEATMEGMGPDRVAYYMRKDPEYIHYVMGEYSKLNVEVIKGLGEAGVEICMMYDDLGQKERPLLSPKNFKKFVLPEYRKMYQAAQKRGIIFIQHSCGNMIDFLPDMIDAGLKGIQALEPASGVKLKEVKEKFGDKIALLNGMDSSATLNFGTQEDVVEDVKKCIKDAGVGGGYFAGPSHNILDVPWENVLAMRDAIEKYRKYPINF